MAECGRVQGAAFVSLVPSLSVVLSTVERSERRAHPHRCQREGAGV